MKHYTYIPDTPDFIRKAEKINKRAMLPQNAFRATYDVIGLFTNIKQEKGTCATEKALNNR